jgi:selenium metabolism protein YedF
MLNKLTKDRGAKIMIQINAMGDACPIPVVKTKKAIQTMTVSDVVETLVDNEVAVQNLMKMATHEGYAVKSEKLGEAQFKVVIDVQVANSTASVNASETTCIPDARTNTVIVISSDKMGEGNDELGAVLIKGFIYAISQQDTLPSTILFYNGGAKLTCEGSASLEDLKTLEAVGVEILTCGTCLNFYGITDKLAVGDVTNMYVIAEKMTKAGLIIKP